MNDKSIRLTFEFSEADWRKIAQALHDAEVGEWSRFCDEPADFMRDDDAERLLANLATEIELLLPPDTSTAGARGVAGGCSNSDYMDSEAIWCPRCSP